MQEVGVGSTLMRLIHSLSAASDSGQEREEEKVRLEARFKESDAALDDLVAKHRLSLSVVTKSYANVSRRLARARAEMAEVKGNLEACRELLVTKRDELKRLWLDGFEQKHIFLMLEKIEILKECPETISSLLSKKKMIEATKTLVTHLDSLENELKNVEGLSEIKNHLLSKKDVLYNLILEDLTHQIYVKSTNEMFNLRRQSSMRDSNFVRSSSGTRSGSSKDQHRGSGRLGESSTTSKIHMRKPLNYDTSSSFLNGRLLSVPEEEEWTLSLDNPLKVNINSGPPQAIIVYVECLTQLNMFPMALDQLRTNMRSELSSIIRKTSIHLLDGPASSSPDENNLLFLELFNTIVEQFYLIIDGFRLLSKASLSSSARHGITPAPILESNEVWEAVQSAVIKGLLSDYLICKDKVVVVNDLSNGGDNSTAANSAAVDGTGMMNSYFLRKRNQRFKKPSLFKFDHSSTALSLNDFMKEQRSDSNTSNTLVCPPNPHNITLIYPSIMEFISEVEKSLKSSEHCTLYNYLTDYVKNDFLQQIAFENVENLNRASNSLDLWEVETELEVLKSLSSSKSLLLALIIVKKCVDKLANYMNNLYLYRSYFFNTIYKMIGKFLEVLNASFRSLIDGSSVASLIFDEDVIRLNKSYPFFWDHRSDSSLKDIEVLNKRELFLIMKKLGPTSSLDIISDSQHLKNLALLSEGLDWFSSNIIALASDLQRSNAFSSHPISDKSLQNLLSVSKDFSDLSKSSILLLHLEIRLHMIHYLSPLSSGTQFLSINASADPSPEVLLLARDLTSIEESLVPILSASRCKYVFEGALYGIGCLLMVLTGNFKRVDGDGVKKLSRNLFSLQYILSSYISGRGEIELEAAKAYFELLSKSPEEVINGIAERGPLFTRDEYESVIKLIHRSSGSNSAKGSGGAFSSDSLGNDLEKLVEVLKLNS